MLKEQVVSVTDLRLHTKQCLENLETNPKFIFSNNRMVAVILRVEEYEMLTRPDLLELPQDQVTDKMKKMADEAIKTPKNQLLNL